MIVSKPEQGERFIFIPAAVAERHRLAAERVRLKHQRYNAKRPERDRGRIPVANRPFVVWDGEGPQDTGYSLLGNSLGDEICYPGLGTADCLDLLLKCGEENPEAIHLSFGFTYDVSCILRDLSWRHFSALKKFTQTVWRDYEIEHVPRKWFQVKRGGVRVRVFDVQSFFASSLVGALKEWKVGPWSSADIISPVSSGASQKNLTVPSLSAVQSMSERELVETFKNLRSEFLWKDIRQIGVYMRLELKYMKILMKRLREALSSAGYIPSSWHGPGAVARMALKRHNVHSAMTPTPDYLIGAVKRAFVAGRFECFQGGHVGRVYTADINSAYPYYCAQLPNLARGSWRHVDSYEPGRFALYKIRYESKPDAYRCYPLPFRHKSGMIAWPHRVTGWYWNPEAALVANDPDARFLEGWVFDEDDPTDRPLAWIAEYYQQRKKWKAEGNPAEYCFKLIINSVYGQFAQRTGWDQKRFVPPRSHQLEWAGWITSSCRAAVYNVSVRCGDDLVSIDTDGVTSRVPFTWLCNSKDLGGWELSEYDDSIFWQSGIYTLKEGDEWTKAKSRGIPKGTYSQQDLLYSLREGVPLKLTKKVFVSYGLALNGQRSSLNTWRSEPHEYVFGGAGKRYHPILSDGRCTSACQGNDMHAFALPVHLFGPFTDPESYPHRLPWLDSKEDMELKDTLTEMVLFDANDLDYEEEWASG